MTDDKKPRQQLLGDVLKQEGQDRVLANEHSRWKVDVERVLGQLIAKGEPFNADDLRRMAVVQAIPEPHHPNCWGALIGAASKAKRITMIGIDKNTIPSAHARLIGKWIRATTEEELLA